MVFISNKGTKNSKDIPLDGSPFFVSENYIEEKTILFDGIWYTKTEWDLYVIENGLLQNEIDEINCAEH